METASIKSWIERWKVTGGLLSNLKRDEFLSSDASEAALVAYPPKPTSGLVEMQKLFRKLAG